MNNDAANANNINHRIGAIIAGYDTAELVRLLGEEQAAGTRPGLLRQEILKALEQVRHKLMSNDVSLAEFLLCIDTTLAGIELLQPYLEQECNQTSSPGSISDTTIVIGVVAGDPHDLGKNVIAGVYRAHGYRVVDLGNAVSQEMFVEAVIKYEAELLALSAMMSTTMSYMPSIIKAIRAYCPGTAIIVGGASLNSRIAASYGADAYAASAVTVIETTQSLVSANPG